MIASPSLAFAQWSTAYEQFYLPGSSNWTFRNSYPAADRLFNAFDYGHAILYERLYNDAHAPVSELEEKEYDFITKKLLVSPPRLPLEEAAIEVNYAKMAPEAKMMFDWAHLLHRQIYDVLASESMSPAQKDARITDLVAYYKTRRDLAFSSKPKNMELMEGQPYSLAFRHTYPKFNGLIWGYHWLQVGLYEPLMTAATQSGRQAGVAAAVTRFRQMLENAPEHMPRVMPMTAAIAPTFATRYQEAAIIFDNLHAMHDVVSDILTNDKVGHGEKRTAILEAARRYRDDTSFIMPVSEWASMGEMMGIANMGGPAVGVLAAWPTPTLARGASMLDAMDNAQGMKGMGGTSAMTHGAVGADTGMAEMKMPGHAASDSSAAGHTGMAGMGSTTGMPRPMHDSSMMRLHERMLGDPVILERVMTDPAMRRMLIEMRPDSAMMSGMPGMAAPKRDRLPGTKTLSPRASTVTSSTRPSTARDQKPPKAKIKASAKKPATSPSATKKSRPKPGVDMKDTKGMPGMKP
ncbi:MAG: hypothetical protein ABI601_20705 [bacterium]